MRAYARGLRRRARQIEQILSRLPETERDRRELFEREWEGIAGKLGNLELAFAEQWRQLEEAGVVLQELAARLPPEELERALADLRRGQSRRVESVLAALVRAEGSHPIEAARAAHQLAVLAQRRVDYGAAYRRFLEAARIDPGNPWYLTDAARFAASIGRRAEARKLHLDALSLQLQVAGRAHPLVAHTLEEIAKVCEGQGDLAQADSLYRRALSIRERVYGPDSPRLVGTLDCLGRVHYVQGDYVSAQPFYERAWKISGLSLQTDPLDAAAASNNLAVVCEKVGQYERSELLHRKGLAIRERVLGPGHVDVGESLNNLAVLAHRRGRFEEARALYLRALRIVEERLGREHPRALQIRRQLEELGRPPSDVHGA